MYTFIDHDGAVSAAAVLRPLRPALCDADHGCPVLATLHGTSIPVRDSADAYKRKLQPSDPEYTFGVDGYWLIAPTRHGARRPGEPAWLNRAIDGPTAIKPARHGAMPAADRAQRARR